MDHVESILQGLWTGIQRGNCGCRKGSCCFFSPSFNVYASRMLVTCHLSRSKTLCQYQESFEVLFTDIGGCLIGIGNTGLGDVKHAYRSGYVLISFLWEGTGRLSRSWRWPRQAPQHGMWTPDWLLSARLETRLSTL